MENKEKVFSKEIDLIKNEAIKVFTIDTLNQSPDYFFKAAASSTGKYHPACTIKEGGLVVHTKRVVWLANELCPGWYVAGDERDLVISACILHDIAKTGKGYGSYEDYVNHPINAVKSFASFKSKEFYRDKVPENKLQEYELSNYHTRINDLVRFHMGLWTPDSIKKPLSEYTNLELLVYTADYLASRKFLVTPVDEVIKKEKKELKDVSTIRGNTWGS